MKPRLQQYLVSRGSSLPNDISTSSLDGSYKYLKIFDENGNIIKESSGLNPSNIKYKNIKDSIINIISDDDIEFANEKIQNKITEEIEKQK